MATTGPQSRKARADIDLDLGFGKTVLEESRGRLLNRDGTFNVRRTGLGLFETVSVYHFLLEISWPRFLALTAVWYILANAAFAAAYMAIGPEALTGLSATAGWAAFPEAFFFSVHTFATIGYGDVTPANWQADVVVTLESLVGLLAFGLAAGLMFARFARPNARIIFSHNAVIAPYKGGEGFEFRIVNSRKNQIIELTARVVLARRVEGGSGRTYHELRLERRQGGHLPSGLDHRASDGRIQPDRGFVDRRSTGLRGRIPGSSHRLRRNVRADGARSFLIPNRGSGLRCAVRQYVRP